MKAGILQSVLMDIDGQYLLYICIDGWMLADMHAYVCMYICIDISKYPYVCAYIQCPAYLPHKYIYACIHIDKYVPVNT